MSMRLCWIVVLASAMPLSAQDMALSQILKEGETWNRVEGTFEPIGGILWENRAKRLELFDLQGKALGFVDETLKSVAGKPDKEFARQTRSVRNDAYTIRNGKLVTFEGREVKIPLKEPTDLEVWSDGGTVVIADAADKFLWAFRIENDGTLGPGDRYYSLYVKRGQTRSEAGAMAMDNMRRLYVATKEGVQVFDPTGRLCGVLAKPSKEAVTAVNFGGENGDLLFVACGKELYVRKMTAQARYMPVPTPKKKG